MSKRYFVLVLGAFVLCLLTMVGSGGWSYLSLVVNLPSLILILILPFLVSLSTFSWRQGLEAFRVGFIHVPAEKKQLTEALVFFGALGRYFLVTALFGFFSGVIAMLVANLRAPNEVGQGAALSLLVVYYALILELLVVLPFTTGVKKRLAERE